MTAERTVDDLFTLPDLPPHTECSTAAWFSPVRRAFFTAA